MNDTIEIKRKQMWAACNLTSTSKSDVDSENYKTREDYKKAGFEGTVYFFRGDINVFDNTTIGTVSVGCVGKTATELIVAFKGTDGWADVIADIEAWQIPFIDQKNKKYGNGKVHTGFFESILSIYESLLAQIRTLMSQNPNLPLYITGHSKGGAMAIIMAQMLSKDIPKLVNELKICTFAAPRVGDSIFKSEYAANEPNHNRYECALDIVPHLPLTTPEYTLFKRLNSVYDGSCPVMPKSIIDAIFWFLENFESYSAVGQYCYVPAETEDKNAQKKIDKYGKYPADISHRSGETLNSLCAIEQLIRGEVFSLTDRLQSIIDAFNMLNTDIHNGVYQYYNR